jgi:hypothetical protein
MTRRAITVVAVVVGLGWSVTAFFFVLHAWGLRGMPKPWWMEVAALWAYGGWLSVPALMLLARRRS